MLLLPLIISFRAVLIAEPAIFQPGHLKMLDGYIDFFMDPHLAECYLKLVEELNKLIQKKVYFEINQLLY